MLYGNLVELMVRERLEELQRVAEHHWHIQEVLAARQVGRRRSAGRLTARSSRILVWLGSRLLAWGLWLHQPEGVDRPQAVAVDQR